MFTVSYVPSEDALASASFETGVSPPTLVQLGDGPPIQVFPGTLTLDNYWSWDPLITTRAVYDGTGWAHKWGGGDAGTSGGIVTFMFDPGSDFTTAETGIIESALALWSAVADIRFVQVTGSVVPDVTFAKYGSSDIGGLGAGTYTAYSAPPGAYGERSVPAISSAFTSFDTDIDYWSELGSFTAYGGYGVDTAVHELGHILGLGHAGPYNGDVDPLTQQDNATDSRQWSIMSYIDPDQPALYSADYTYQNTDWGGSADGYARVPTTWMPVDILAAQLLYGVAQNTPLSGGQVFGFNCNVDPSIRDFFDFTVNTAPVITLWDAGTGNALDLSGFAGRSSVNLNPGSFSSADGMINNIGIAYGTRIDRLVGSSGGATVIVNADADTVQGTGGTNVAVFATAAQVYLAAPGAGGAAAVLSGAGVTDTLLDVQVIGFTGGNDTISANAGAVDLAGGGNALYLGAQYASVQSAGADTVVAGPGGAAVDITGSVGSLVFGSAAALNVTTGGGADTIVTGSGDAQVQGGVGQTLVWADGPLSFLGSAGSSTVLGGAASVTVWGGSGGGVFVGGSAGNDVLVAYLGGGTLVGAGSGDQMLVDNAGANVVVAGAGAETIWGGTAAVGDNSFWAGSGDDLMVGGIGNTTFVAGTGDSTVVASGGGNTLVVFDGLAGGQLDVTGWNPRHDQLDLERFASGAAAGAIASAVVAGGSTIVTLPDATRITFAGVSGIGNGWFG